MHEGIKKYSHESDYFIWAYFREIDDIDRHLPGQKIVAKRWCPPDPDFIKIKFDATLQNHTKESCPVWYVGIQMDGFWVQESYLIDTYLLLLRLKHWPVSRHCKWDSI